MLRLRLSQEYLVSQLAAQERLFAANFDSLVRQIDALRLLKEHDLANIQLRFGEAKEALGLALNANNESMRKVEASNHVQATAIQHEIDGLHVAVARMGAQFETSDKASAVERAGMDRRLETMNEFRAQIKDEHGLFLTRGEFNGEHGRILDLVSNGDERLKRLETGAANLQGRMWGIGFLLTAANVLISFWLSSGHH